MCIHFYFNFKIIINFATTKFRFILNAIDFNRRKKLKSIKRSEIFSLLFFFRRYMDDLTQKYQSDKQSWTKTLQGLAIRIQCMNYLYYFFSVGSSNELATRIA